MENKKWKRNREREKQKTVINERETEKINMQKEGKIRVRGRMD